MPTPIEDVEYRCAAALDCERRCRSLSMRRTVRWLATGMLFGLLVAACGVAPDDDTSGQTRGQESGDGEAAPRIAVPVLAVTPARPTTTDAIEAAVTNADAWGDDVTVAWAWTSDGGVVHDGPTLGADATARGDVWTVRATASSVAGDARSAEARVTIENTPPALGGATVDVDDSTRAGTATCVASGWADPDGDAQQVDLRWFRDDAGDRFALADDTDTLRLAILEPGDAVVCEARGYDAFDVGRPVQSAPVVVENQRPRVEAVAVVGPPVVGALLECRPVGVEDADGDPVDIDVRWAVDGAVLDGVTGRGWVADRVGTATCTVTPRDAWDAGAPVESAPIPIEVDLDPWPRVEMVGTTACEDWTCAVPGWTDEDAIVPVFRWTVDGVPVAASGATLAADDIAPGQTVGCAAAPWDGATVDRLGEPVVGDWTASGVRTVADPISDVTGARIRDRARPGDVLTCALDGLSDACAAPAATWTWTVNGRVDPLANGPDFATLGLVAGDRVRCIARVEGAGGGAIARRSNEVTLSVTGYRIHGDREGGMAGASVAVSDDLDGNDYAELVIGSPGFSRGEAIDAGAVYVINGRDDVAVQDLATVRARFEPVIESPDGGYVLGRTICRPFTTYDGGCPQVRPSGELDAYTAGPRGAGLGTSVSWAGDIDGDGVGDILAGAPYQRIDELWQGRTFVLSGNRMSSRSDAEALSGVPGAGYVFDGECGRRTELDAELPPQDARRAANGDLSGYRVAGMGDVNGDGLGDFAVGAVNSGPDDEGIVYVVFGRADGAAVTADAIHTRGCGAETVDEPGDGEAGFAILGWSDGGGERWGLFVAPAGDFDGDGYDDILVHPGGLAGTRTFVVRGGADVGAVELETAGLPQVIPIDVGDFGFRDGAFYGRLASGLPASGGGDVNGDGYDDLVFHTLTIETGAGITVLFGGPLPDEPLHLDQAADGTRGWTVDEVPDLVSGEGSAAIIGDANGDGYDDVVVGSPSEDGDRGAAWLVFGGPTSPGASLTGIEAGIGGVAILGGDRGERVGTSVGGGDVDGDGLDDLLVGAPHATIGDLEGAGFVAIEYGRDFGGVIDGYGDDRDDTFDGTAGDERFVGGRGDDRLNGGGGADVLYGGTGDDTLVVSDLDFRRVRGGAGEDTLVFAAGCPDPDLREIGGRVDDVERFDIDGQSLTIAAANLARMSQTSNRLIVTGASGRVVTPPGDGWIDTGAVEVDGRTYYTVVAGWAELWVDDRLETRMPPTVVTDAITLPENTPVGDAFATLEVSDPDGDDAALTFALTDETTAPVTIDADTGALAAAGDRALDYEADPRSYVLGLAVTDDSGITIEVALPVHLGDVNEAPVFSSAEAWWSVDEGVADVEVIGSSRAVDVDADDAVVHRIVADPSEKFRIDPDTGAVRLREGVGLDYETATEHTLSVVAEDVAGLSARQDITVAVMDRERIARTVQHTFAMRDRNLRADEPSVVHGVPDFDGEPLIDEPTCIEYSPVQSWGFNWFSRLWGESWEVQLTGTVCLEAYPGRTSGQINADLPVGLSLSVPDEVTPGTPFAVDVAVTPHGDRALFWGETPELWVELEISFGRFGITLGSCDGDGDCSYLIDTYGTPVSLTLADQFGYQSEAFALRSAGDGFRFVTPRPIGADDEAAIYDARPLWEYIWTAAGFGAREGRLPVGDPEVGELEYVIMRPEITVSLDGEWEIDFEVDRYGLRLEMEDGTVHAWDVGESPTITVESDDDLDADGRVAFTLTVRPFASVEVDERSIDSVAYGFLVGLFRFFEYDEDGEVIRPPYQFGPMQRSGCGEFSVCIETDETVDLDYEATGIRPLTLRGAIDLGGAP